MRHSACATLKVTKLQAVACRPTLSPTVVEPIHKVRKKHRCNQCRRQRRHHMHESCLRAACRWAGSATPSPPLRPSSQVALLDCVVRPWATAPPAFPESLHARHSLFVAALGPRAPTRIRTYTCTARRAPAPATARARASDPRGDPRDATRPRRLLRAAAHAHAARE